MRKGRSIKGIEGMIVEAKEIAKIVGEREDVAKVKEIIEGGDSKSERIRTLYALGIEVGEIGKLLGIRYNFAYNVISRDVGEVRKSRSGVNKSELIREGWRSGESIGEISKRLNINYNYCWSVVEKERKKEENDAGA